MSDGWGGDAVLVTERLTLRPFALEDLPIYRAMCADPVVMEFLGGPWSAERTQESMLGANRRLADDGYGIVAIERRSDGTFLGAAGLGVEQWYPDDVQLGWRLAPEHWGHGYASEAARAWMERGFTTIDLERILAMADVPNDRSVAVMRGLGMQWDHEAALMDGDEPFDAVIYVITVSDWRNQREGAT